MALYTKMQKLMDATVEQFCRRLVETHADAGLDIEEMMGLWKETAKAPKKKDGKPKKRTAYMNFAQAMRGQIKEEQPDIKFGEISTEVSRRWKLLTVEEKATYASASVESPALSVTAALSPVAVASPVKKFTSPSPKKAVATASTALGKGKSSPAPSPKKAAVVKKLTVPELKKLCKDKGLGIKGLKTRQEFEELLETVDSEDEGSDSGGEYTGTLVEEDDEGVLA